MQVIRTLFQHWRLILVITLVALGLLFLGLSLTASPRLIGTDPKPSANTTFDYPVTITFNQTLSAETTKTFAISPEVEGTASIEGKTFRFDPTYAYDIGTTYKVTLTPVGTNNRRGKEVTLSFTPNEVTQQPSIPTLTAVLPHKHTHYLIEYTVNPDNSLNIYIGLNPTVSPSQPAQYQTQLRQYRDEAFAFIKQHGGDLAKLNLLVHPNPEIQSDEDHVNGSLQ